MDLYELLGIPRGATLIEIKRSYKRLARKYHPDINPGDNAAEARFKEITRAYETLSDPERRLRYDAGALSAVSASVSVEFEGFDFSGGVAHADATTFGDLFAEVFAQRQDANAAEPVRGADLHASVSLTFEEAMRGAQRQMTLTRRDTCQSCRGAGALKIAEARCQRCQGSGLIRSRRGSMVFSKSCDACGGSGRLQQTACGRCGGSGVEMRSETITVGIPAGVSDGARIRVPAPTVNPEPSLNPMPRNSATFLRLTRYLGWRPRSFIWGIRSVPPASTLPPSPLERSRSTASLTVDGV